MTNFDLIGVLRNYAATKGWIFLSGAEFYQNAELTRATLTANKVILGVMFTAKPSIKNGKVISIQYNGKLMLGEKFETTTTSSLDELFIQKYDRRLLTLMTLLATTIGDIACTNELDISGLNFDMKLNAFDENIDGVECSVTFTQGI